MKTVVALLAAVALCCAASASASFHATYWSLKDMKTAIRAVGYPHPHPKTLHCSDHHAMFKCSATYTRKPKKARFVIEGVGVGGWLCAGKTFAGCELLRHGFVTTNFVNSFGDLGKVADTASRSYLVNHGQSPYTVTHYCQQAEGSTSTWTCAFTVNNEPVTVTMTFTQARGGYVTAGSE